jgi:hypothetical protein
MKHLDKLRDEKGPQAYNRHCTKYKTSDCDFAEAYDYGWNDCQAEIMKLVEELKHQLVKSAYHMGNAYCDREDETYLKVQCDILEVLKKLRELEGGE